MIMRLWPHHHNDPALRDETLELLKAHRGICNEVWFCSELGTPTLEAHEKSAARMREAAALFRDAGIKASIQIANTLGHADTFFEAIGGPWQRMVGHDGITATVGHCPRAPEFLDYLHHMTTAYARWQPSAVWIDDDLRMFGHYPVEYGCFCPSCLRRFSEMQNREWTREKLVSSLKTPGGDLRAHWVEFGQESLAGIASVISGATYAVAPECFIGLQQVGADLNLYNGHDWKTVFRAIQKACPLPMGSRPGGGYYADHAPRGVLGKALDMARQVRALPADVGTVCFEIDNFTHNAMGKTAHGTAIESAWYLAQSECNSLSYALFCSAHEDAAFYGSQLSVLEKWAPFYERYLRENEGTSPGGFDPVMGCEHLRRPALEKDAPLAWASASFARSYGLATLALPLCPDGPASCGMVLSAEAASGLTETEARRMLSGGVILDGQALYILNQRGWGEWTGVAAVPFGPKEYYFERFTDSALNGSHAGKVWQQLGFGASPDNFRIECSRPDAQVLGNYFEPTTSETRAIATVAVETPLGGRLAVLGFNGFETNVSSARRQQVLSLADWVSRRRLPVILETSAQVALVARVTESGALRSVLLMNLTIDHTPPLSLKLRNLDGTNITLNHPPGRLETSLVAKKTGDEWHVELPPMEPWNLAYLKIA